MDKKIRQNRLTMRLHQDRKRQEVINGAAAENLEATLISEAISKIGPSQFLIGKSRFGRARMLFINWRWSERLETRLLMRAFSRRNIRWNKRICRASPACNLCQTTCLTAMRPSKLRSRILRQPFLWRKKMKDFVCLHFHGTRTKSAARSRCHQTRWRFRETIEAIQRRKNAVCESVLEKTCGENRIRTFTFPPFTHP